jgi:two-component system LytT family response regulator
MESKLRVLIVDDEPLARRRLRRLLTDEGDVEVVAECSSAAEASAVIDSENPDLIFLDVQMPEQDGFSLLRQLPADRRPEIVFVTAFDQYAIDAFQVHALDYVMKPIDAERLHESLERARARVGAQDAATMDRKLKALLDELTPRGRFLERILVRNPGRISFVNVEEIHWIGAEGNYVRLHLGRERHLVRQKIGALEERLDPRRFLRIHRSAIVSLDHVKELHRLPGGDYAVVLDTGVRLTMSRSYKERFEAVVGHGVELSG